MIRRATIPRQVTVVTVGLAPDMPSCLCWKEEVYSQSTQNNERHVGWWKRKFAASEHEAKQNLNHAAIKSIKSYKEDRFVLSHPPTHWSFVLEEFRPNRQSDPEAPEKTLNYSGSAILTATTSSPTLTAASPLAPRGASASDTQQVTGEALAALLHHQPQPIFLLFHLVTKRTRFSLVSPFAPTHRTQYGARPDNVFQFAG